MDQNTEDKIKDSAKELFVKKGYARTTTRDIAELAGVNVALVNYYYRSKEQLLNTIMLESIAKLYSMIFGVINNREISLSEKIDIAVNKYIDVLSDNPQIPIFLLSEIKNNSIGIFKQLNIEVNALRYSNIREQLDEQISEKGLPGSALHYIVNILSMTVMPIAAKQFVQMIYEIDEDEYAKFINERRVLIPIWLKSMLKLD